MRGSRGGGRGSGPPLEFAKLNIADITENEKIIYFSYLCTSTVIRQTESILLKVGSLLEKFFGSAPVVDEMKEIYFTSISFNFHLILAANERNEFFRHTNFQLILAANERNIFYVLCIFEFPAYFSRTNGCRLLTTDQNNQVRVYLAPEWHLEKTILHPHRFFQHITPIKVCNIAYITF